MAMKKVEIRKSGLRMTAFRTGVSVALSAVLSNFNCNGNGGIKAITAETQLQFHGSSSFNTQMISS